MEANAPNSEEHESSPGAGLGGRLVAAREARGLTLAVVANRLRLSAATLQALESSRFEDLPEPIFVRGYLRAYARLLGMDTEVFVAEYDRLADKPGPILAPTPKVHRQAAARAPYLRGATALLGVAMAVLIFLLLNLPFVPEASLRLALVSAIAVVIAMTVGTLSGACIPLVMRSLGIDPAQSSAIVLILITDGVSFTTLLFFAFWILDRAG